VSSHIDRKFLVMSGKGGVGKSSIAANLATWLARQGKRVGLLDVDIHGPSVPNLFGLHDVQLVSVDEKIEPVLCGDNLKVMSIGLMLPNANEAVIWRGPMKHNMIQQFVEGVAWGELDYLVVDCPPGTGDEALSTAQVLGSIDGAMIVTTPQALAVADVRKCVTFCKQLNLPVLGIVENMSGFICPHCQKRTDIFPGDGGEEIARDFKVPFLGRIPMNPMVAQASDIGRPYIDFDKDSPTAQAFEHVFTPLIAGRDDSSENTQTKKETSNMKIAIPLADGKLTAHFGHCGQFAVVDVNEQSKTIAGQVTLDPPPHEPGVLPAWLAEQGASLVIAGGMGQRAQQLFAQHGIQVIVGAPVETPERLVTDYLAGTLQTGTNVCDH